MLTNTQLNNLKNKTRTILRIKKKNIQDNKISKIIQSGGFFGSWLGYLGKSTLTNVAFPLARDTLLQLASSLSSNAINQVKRKISGKGAVRTGKEFTLFILNKDINDINKITKSLEDSNVLIDGITETVNIKYKKQECGFFLFC